MLRLPSFARLRIVAALLVSVIAAAAPAAAQALCQLHFTGRVAVQDYVEVDGGGQRSRFTGHLVEVEIGATVGQETRDLVLHLHLARGTTGADLARIVATRLERLHVDATLVPGEGGEASLWIDSASHVSMRLGGGLHVDIACAEGPPRSLRILPPSAILADARLTVAASSALIRRDRSPVRSRVSTDIEMSADTSSAAIAAKLWEATSKTWVSDRPGGNSWQPHKMVNGATITGVSFHIDSPGNGDWRFELEL